MKIDTLWYTRCPAPTAASIAIRQGWLEQEFAADGIAVRSIASAAERSVHQSHYTQSQPNAFRYGGYVPPLIARSRGADIRLIGIAWHDRVHAFYALPGSGIERAEHLRGKRIAVPRRLNDEIDWWRASVLGGLKALHEQTDLRPDDLVLVDLPVARRYMEDATPGQASGQSLWGAWSQMGLQREEVAALVRGEVDAVYADGALTALLAAATGARPVVTLRGNEDDASGAGTPCVLTVSGELLRQRPDLVDRWVGRLLDAPAWAVAHRDEVHRLFARETGLPEDLLHAAYSPRLPEQADVALNPARLALVRAKVEHLLAHGFLAAPFDFEAFVDDGPLRRATERRQAATPQRAPGAA
jgi:ABC-type nitrate/sulfonate/bicarbonate transport system substrate-binding protein